MLANTRGNGMKLHNASEFPTIGKESSQVYEIALWGSAPPFNSTDRAPLFGGALTHSNHKITPGFLQFDLAQ
jgi:hypothetical protein